MPRTHRRATGECSGLAWRDFDDVRAPARLDVERVAIQRIAIRGVAAEVAADSDSSRRALNRTSLKSAARDVSGAVITFGET